MHVSDDFARGLRAVLVGALVLVASLFLLTSINPPGHVHAQNAGVVGIQANMLTAYTNKTAPTCSSIFNDIGQGANTLFVVDSAVGGGVVLIDLEWSPTGSAPFYIISQASYSDPASATPITHQLGFGGYYKNLRSCIRSYTSGTWSAYFSEISGPISSAAAAVGTNGPTSPIACDQNAGAPVSTGTTLFLGPQPLNTGDVVVVCSTTVSFNGATAAGSLIFEWSASSACTAPFTAYINYTNASTPQTYTIPTQLRGLNNTAATANFLCVNNTSGSTASFLLSYASIHPL